MSLHVIPEKTHKHDLCYLLIYRVGSHGPIKGDSRSSVLKEGGVCGKEGGWARVNV